MNILDRAKIKEDIASAINQIKLITSKELQEEEQEGDSYLETIQTNILSRKDKVKYNIIL